jgi:hypothetical protein
VWALVYVIELARTEDHYSRLRPVIWGWWLLWLLSTMTSVFATVTSGAQDSQGVANNTVAMIVAYLLALMSVLVTARLFEGFEAKPVERPAHRWIPVESESDAPADREDAADLSGSPAAVELTGAEPAA